MNLTVSDIGSEYNKRFLFYEPNPKQESFHNAGAEAIERLFLAGNRTGKTYSGCIEDAMHLTGRYPEWWKGHRFNHPIKCWVSSKSSKDVRNVLQPKFFGGHGEDNEYSQGLIDPSLILKKVMASGGGIDFSVIKHWTGGFSYLYFKSYEQGREKFQGERCHVIHNDEEPPYDIYLECLMRLADVDGLGQGRLILTMTPLKGYTEMMAYFLQGRAKNDNDSEEKKDKDEILRIPPEVTINGKYYIQATWDDNLHLSQETKERLRATLKPHELEAREKGIPCLGSGMVYQVPESEFLIPPFEIPKHWAHVYGLDFGFDPSPTAVLFIARDRETDTVYVYGEYTATKLTPQLHAANLWPLGCDWMYGVCDPAGGGKSQIDGSKAFDVYIDLRFKLTKSSNAKEVAVTNILERIRTGRLKVFSNCRKFMNEWRSYARDKKGKIIKGNDHLMNCLEYITLDGLPLARTKVEQVRTSGSSHPGIF